MSFVLTVNPLTFPSGPHVRRHYPMGYDDYTSYKPWLRDEFTFRCAYCLIRERWYPSGQAAFGVDHYLPLSKHPALACEYGNLFYICNRCNFFKGEEDGVLNPCQVNLAEHIRFDAEGIAQSLTPEGQIHILVLDINGPEAVEYRRTLLTIIRNAQRDTPPDDSILEGLLGLPTDLPDLRSKRPPKGNLRKSGLRTCYFERKRRGESPSEY